MTPGPGDLIGAYRLTEAFTSKDAGNCRYAFAVRDGRAFFIKEFFKPKYPPEGLPPAIRDAKLARCQRFEDRYRRLVATVGKVSATGGNVVLPTDFMRIGPVYYLVAPRIRTDTLAPGEVAALPVAARLQTLRILARALGTLHSQDLVHCDLKPSNVLIQRTEAGLHATKIIDFDGSFFAGSPPDQEEMAFDQNYMAPEVLAYAKAGGDTPEAARGLGTAADAFSCGILLHEYWTGRRPDTGKRYPAEVVSSGGTVPLAAPATLGPLAAILPGLLQRDPAARPRMTELDALLAEAQRAVSATPVRESTKPLGPALRGTLKLPTAAGPIPRPGFAEEAAPPPTPPPAGRPSLIISSNLRPKRPTGGR